MSEIISLKVREMKNRKHKIYRVKGERCAKYLIGTGIKILRKRKRGTPVSQIKISFMRNILFSNSTRDV